jgi:hypothetical protein
MLEGISCATAATATKRRTRKHAPNLTKHLIFVSFIPLLVLLLSRINIVPERQYSTPSSFNLPDVSGLSDVLNRDFDRL